VPLQDINMKIIIVNDRGGRNLGFLSKNVVTSNEYLETL
jgi:hypothetical protein